MPFDEKWAFVAKKEKHCDRADEADDFGGDCWDHVALDPEHRLVVSAVVGKHSAEHIDLLVEDFHRRTGGRLMDRMTSDENPAYAEAILACYGEEYQPQRRGRRGRRPARRKRPPRGLNYAMVHKTREKNRSTVEFTTVNVYGGNVESGYSGLTWTWVGQQINIEGGAFGTELASTMEVQAEYEQDDGETLATGGGNLSISGSFLETGGDAYVSGDSDSGTGDVLSVSGNYELDDGTMNIEDKMLPRNSESDFRRGA